MTCAVLGGTHVFLPGVDPRAVLEAIDRHRVQDLLLVPSMLQMLVDHAGEEVPRGTVGEVVARGAHVMLGYWNRPLETAEAVRCGWMHTGDAGYMDPEGYVYIVDRVKDMMITRGENV